MPNPKEGERKPAKETFIGKSPWTVIGKLLELNPKIESLYFCAIDPQHYTKPFPKDPQFHNSTFAYGELSRSGSFQSLDQSLVGRRIYLELLLESGALSFLEKKVSNDSHLNEFLPKITNLIKEQREAFIPAIISAVKMNDGSFKHIPMIDFSSSGLGHDLEKAKNGLKSIGEKKGFILDSGRSLHYYGLDLLSEEDWPKFIGRSLLLNTNDSRIIDNRFIGHRLIDGYGCLRITDHSVKPSVPRIIAVFGNIKNQDIKKPEDNAGFLAGEKSLEALRRSGKPLIEL